MNKQKCKVLNNAHLKYRRCTYKLLSQIVGQDKNNTCMSPREGEGHIVIQEFPERQKEPAVQCMLK
jgi:hypothetical protein